MKKTLSFLLFLCFSILQSQIIFEKGYFIDNNGQRTDCSIENLDWRSNPTSFTYTLNESDIEPKIQTIAAVSEFGINDVSMYRRFTVNIERSQSSTANLAKNKTPQWKSETLFLFALVTGEANLYSYVDGNITKYFYETKSIPIEQLVYIRYLSDSYINSGLSSYGESIRDNKQFLQQLHNNVNCGDMNEKTFLSLEYKKNSLVKHFLVYNTCNGNSNKNTTNYTSNDGKREMFALRVVAGVSSGNLSVADPNNFYDMSTEVSQVAYRIGLEAEYILPFQKGRWSIFANPSYQKFDPSKNFTSQVNNPGFGGDGNLVNYTFKLKYSYVEIPFGVRRYFFINKSSRIFANIAYVVVFSKSGQTMDFTNSNNFVNANQSIPIATRNNFAIGLGYAFRRFSGEIRYNTPRQLSKYLQWDSDYTTIGLLLGFKLL